MLRVCLALLLAAVSFAQTPPETSPKAPPHLDAALRARVTKFYQYEVDGKFRLAEQLVAEDTKDSFVGATKPAYYGFEIKSIEYSKNFREARVIVAVSRMVPVEGFTGHPVPGLVPSRWKLEKGLWCWYVDPRDVPRSPFGNLPMPPGMANPQIGAQTGGRALPQLPVTPGMSPRPEVRVDKTAVELKSGAPSSDQVTIVSPIVKPVTLALVDPKIPGLTVKLDRTDLNMGDKAILSIQSNGSIQPPPQPITVTIRVLETKQTVPIRVSFAKAEK